MLNICDQIEKNQMGGHVKRTGRGEVHTGFWWGKLRERDHLEDPSVDGTIILKWVFRKWEGGMDWICLAQNRDRLRAVVYAATNLRFPYNAGNFLTSWETVSFSRRTLLHEECKCGLYMFSALYFWTIITN